MRDGGDGAAWHYDGRTAIRHRVHVRAAQGRLHIVETDESVALESLRATGDPRIAAYGVVDQPGWRIELIAPADPALLALLPAQEKHGRLMDRFGVGPVMIVGTVLSVLVLVLFGYGSRIAARAMPISWEIALGDTLSGRLQKGTCRTPAGDRALDRLVARLHPDGPPIRVVVVDLPVVNAVSLPGRQIMIFRGLIEQARSPDEVAGVLAHEIGHVERRDPLVALIRGYGLSLLIGGVDGGAVMQTLVANRYSRSDERGADAAALAMLGQAHIAPRATAAFFDRLSQNEPSALATGTMATFLSTHPLSAERRQLFQNAPSASATPALSRRDWQALQQACPDGGQGKAGAARPIP